MTTEQKIIKNKVGLLELARQLGNVSGAPNGSGALLQPRCGRLPSGHGIRASVPKSTLLCPLLVFT